MADLEFIPANPFELDARMRGLQPSPQPQQPEVQTPQPPRQEQTAGQEPPPLTYGAYARQVNARKGDYFSHDNRAYHRRDGKTYLLTGDAMGDVELDADQSAKLDKDMADRVARDQAQKEGPIHTDQVPGGIVDPNDAHYAAPDVSGRPNAAARPDTPFNRLPPNARAAAIGLGVKHLTKPILGKVPLAWEFLPDAAGTIAGLGFRYYDRQTPELDLENEKK